MLGHKLAGVMTVYKKHDYLKDQEHAYITWFNHLSRLNSEQNVVPFRINLANQR